MNDDKNVEVNNGHFQKLSYELIRDIFSYVEPANSTSIAPIDEVNKSWRFWANSIRNENHNDWKMHLEHLVGTRLATEFFQRFSTYKKAFCFVENAINDCCTKIDFSAIENILKESPEDFIDNDNYYFRFDLKNVDEDPVLKEFNVSLKAVVEKLELLGMTGEEIEDYLPCIVAKAFIQKYGINVPSHNFSLLHLYCFANYDKGVRYLVHFGENVNKCLGNSQYDISPLEAALFHMVYSFNDDPDKQFISSRRQFDKNSEICNFLLDNGAGVVMGTFYWFLEHNSRLLSSFSEINVPLFKRLLDALFKKMTPMDHDTESTTTYEKIESKFSTWFKRAVRSIDKGDEHFLVFSKLFYKKITEVQCGNSAENLETIKALEKELQIYKQQNAILKQENNQLRDEIQELESSVSTTETHDNIETDNQGVDNDEPDAKRPKFG